MAEKQQTDKKTSEQEQAILADREARRAELYHNLDSGGMKGIVGIIVWFIVVALIFALMYFLS